jgi:hypothetical protein
MKRRKLQVPDRLDLVAPVEIQAAESSDGDKKVATFSIRAYTGGVMQVHGFFDPVIVDLQGLKARGTQIPILNGHSHDRIVGHSTDVEVSDQGVSVRGVVSGVGFYANEVVESAKNGFPWQASIGASVDRALFLEEGETMVINGQTVKDRWWWPKRPGSTKSRLCRSVLTPRHPQKSLRKLLVRNLTR